MSRRLAVILPTPYRGGTLRAAKDVARMLREIGDRVGFEVVFALPPDPPGVTLDLDDLRDDRIAVRRFEWREMPRVEAQRIEQTALEPLVRPIAHDHYWYPWDGAANLLDCDFWLFFSDRVLAPLLPLRRYGVVIFDCLQRVVPEIMTQPAWDLQRRALIPFVREAEVIFTTTPVTAADVQSFIGVPRARIRQIPMFFETPTPPAMAAAAAASEPYLLWVTNHARHKNHLRSLDGLEQYYERHDGRLRTIIVGTETKYFRPRTPYPHDVVEDYVGRVRRRIAESPILRRRVTIDGEVSDAVYAERLAGAQALLHSCLYDNGTFSVLDAAALGVPALSARYPAMEFMDREFGLNLAWFDPFDAKDLARALATLDTHRPVPAPRDRILDRERTSRLQAAHDIHQAIDPWLQATP